MCKFKHLTALVGMTLMVSNCWADPTKPEFLQPAESSLSVNAESSAPVAIPVLSFIQIGQRRSAVINGQLVKVGDRVANYLVQQIDARQCYFLILYFQIKPPSYVQHNFPSRLQNAIHRHHIIYVARSPQNPAEQCVFYDVSFSAMGPENKDGCAKKHYLELIHVLFSPHHVESREY